jgi:hypothetical protein
VNRDDEGRKAERWRGWDEGQDEMDDEMKR